MSEEQPRDEQREDQHPVPLTQTLGFGAGTMLAAGMVDLVAHLGPTRLVVGGVAAYVASQHRPELAKPVRGALPSPVPLATKQAGKAHNPRPDGGKNLPDRALGRFSEQEDK